MTTYTLEQLEAADIATGTDPHGRPVLWIDDHDARTLRRWIGDHWTEIHGVGAGYSSEIRPGHHLYELVHAIAQAAGRTRPFICGRSMMPGTGDGPYDVLVSTFGVATRHRPDGTPVYHFDA